jgi:hypothetical protein
MSVDLSIMIEMSDGSSAKRVESSDVEKTDWTPEPVLIAHESGRIISRLVMGSISPFRPDVVGFFIHNPCTWNW